MIEEGNKRKTLVDVLIIVAVAFAVLAIALPLQGRLYGFVNNESAPLMGRVGILGAVQFGIAGLGITIVALVRRESFLLHGLQLKGMAAAIALSALCFVPHLIFLIATGNVTAYLPFQGVEITKAVLAAGFPENVFGMLIIAVAWGFFEGFNYVFFCDKFNELLPSRKKWLDWGALFCAVMCIVIHGAIGVTPEGIAEMLTILFLIYGMLLVRKFTGNAWGSVFVFVFLWNAF
jgi:hypothetical protein